MTAMVNLLPLVFGLGATWAFFALPWLVVSTPVVELVHQEIGALALSTVGAWLTGGCLGGLWLVPIGGLMVTLVSSFGIAARGTSQKITGVVQLVLGGILLLPMLAFWVSYQSFLNMLGMIIQLPDPIQAETFVRPGLGFYVALVTCVTSFAAGIANVRTT